MRLTTSDLIEVRRIPIKGRGVFARTFIEYGTEIERVPLIFLEEDVMETSLADYVFEWGEGGFVLALGYGSLYNHSFKPNARYDDHEPDMKSFSAIRDIHAGEEITINYNGSPEIIEEVDFEVVD